MTRYIIRRILLMIPTLLGVFLVVFFVIRMIPGDPAVLMLGGNATDEQIAVYKYPRVVRLGTLPKGPTGKILKREIKFEG